ncbi:MAG: DNA polymerase III subunit delta [bacterium]|nr:DNA polymerase III subunit delta [bacterium]
MTLSASRWYTIGMTPQQLFTDISAGNFKPLYYFYGSEDYRIVEAQRYVARQFLPDKQAAVNFLRIDGKKTKCSDLLAQLSVYPMLGERQVFAVSSFQKFKPTEVDRVLKMLVPADPNRIVILSSPGSKTPKRSSAFLKKVGKAAEAVEFGRMNPRETAVLIQRKLTKAELSIETDAVTILVGLIAGNRGALEVEIDKIIDFKESGQSVTVEDVRAVTSGYQVYSIFELADEIVGRHRARVLQHIRNLLAEGNSPTGALFFLGQHFVSLYLVKNGQSLEPYRRWLAPKFRQQAESFNNRQLEYAILEVARVDAALRRGRQKPRLALEQLALSLMAPPQST